MDRYTPVMDRYTPDMDWYTPVMEFPEWICDEFQDSILFKPRTFGPKTRLSGEEDKFIPVR